MRQTRYACTSCPRHILLFFFLSIYTKNTLRLRLPFGLPLLLLPPSTLIAMAQSPSTPILLLLSLWVPRLTSSCRHSESLSMLSIPFSPLRLFFTHFFSRTSYRPLVKSESHIPGNTYCTSHRGQHETHVSSVIRTDARMDRSR